VTGAQFAGKRFTLLWRGSRKGFGAGDFHSRCDGHPPTLTLIQDTKGNIFGGFTPVEWVSRALSCYTNLAFPQGLSESEESAQFPGEEICAEGRNEAPGNLV
jgi:hypothetical protein